MSLLSSNVCIRAMFLFWLRNQSWSPVHLQSDFVLFSAAIQPMTHIWIFSVDLIGSGYPTLLAAFAEIIKKQEVAEAKRSGSPG